MKNEYKKMYEKLNTNIYQILFIILIKWMQHYMQAF